MENASLEDLVSDFTDGLMGLMIIAIRDVVPTNTFGGFPCQTPVPDEQRTEAIKQFNEIMLEMITLMLPPEQWEAEVAGWNVTYVMEYYRESKGKEVSDICSIPYPIDEAETREAAEEKFKAEFPGNMTLRYVIQSVLPIFGDE